MENVQELKVQSSTKEKKMGSISSIIFPVIVVLITIALVAYPKTSIESAKNGINLWFNSVFPSLFPFMVCSNLLISFGVANLLGAMIEPIMRKVFGVSGNGGYAFSMGILSGYPMGAKTICELKEKEQLSEIESVRLLSFVNNSGPLFIIGAVGTTMLGSVNAGYFLYGVHIFSAIVVGILFRFYFDKIGYVDKSFRSESKFDKKNFSSYKKNVEVKNPIGLIIGETIIKSMEVVLQVGGFIILFSVISGLLDKIGFFMLITDLIGNKYLDKQFISGIISGIIEMTNGLSVVGGLGISLKSFVISAILIGFGGLSIHAQSVSFISRSRLSSNYYFVAKIFQAVISGFLAYLCFTIFKVRITNVNAALVSLNIDNVVFGNFFSNFLHSLNLFFYVLIGLFGIGVICSFIMKMFSLNNASSDRLRKKL